MTILAIQVKALEWMMVLQINPNPINLIGQFYGFVFPFYGYGFVFEFMWIWILTLDMDLVLFGLGYGFRCAFDSFYQISSHPAPCLINMVLVIIVNSKNR